MKQSFDGRFAYYQSTDGKYHTDFPIPRSSTDLDSLHQIWLSDVGMVQLQFGRRLSVIELKTAVPQADTI